MDSLAGFQVVDEVVSALKLWDSNIGGNMPKIETVWDESMVLFSDTDSYILITIDQEIPQIFSMMEGVSPNYLYRWYHIVNLTLDIRTNKERTRFEQIIDYAMYLLKQNVRLAGAIQQFPVQVFYDTTIRNNWRMTISIRVDVESPQSQVLVTPAVGSALGSYSTMSYTGMSYTV